MAASVLKSQTKGEIYELKVELKSEKRDKKKNAIKRIIGFMTVGKDVSELFMDVVNCMQTDNLELKKLVYLYLMNYAKSHPDLAILAVNSFVKDCDDPNPLIRALAVRTMGCIRVSNISEYLCEPLRKCLKDHDPYVRKTAVVCVAKLYNIQPELLEEQGFINQLYELLGDPNPMVISNCVACLTEISSRDPQKKYFEINSDMVNRLLTALNECTEWGQSYILDSISSYNPRSGAEALSICERVTSRLSHSNSALVLSTIKIILKMLNFIKSDNPLVQAIEKKMSPPLITMLSYEPEIQYVALRNIDLITQKSPNLLKNELKSFFVKYNDPIYIKLEKLGIIIKLVDEKNIQQILAELKEYSTEVDVDFVRKSVKAIGRCALKVETSADQCVSTLLDLIQTKVSYVVQESIIVMRDIMRKIPNRYESIIEKLCENLDSLNEPEARGALIWIIGEYAERIDNASDVLKSFSANFLEENASVQLNILTAVVKLFLKKPTQNQELVQDVLTLVTQQCENPDIRDRGFIYWRLLSTDPTAAKNVVLANKPTISPEADNLDSSLLEELLQNLATLASIYHKSPQTFLEGVYTVKATSVEKPQLTVWSEATYDDILQIDIANSTTEKVQQQAMDAGLNLLDMDFGMSLSQPLSNNVVAQKVPPGAASQAPIDLLSDLFSDINVTSSQFSGAAVNTSQSLGSSQVNRAVDVNDIYGIIESQFVSPAADISLITWLPSNKGKGLEVCGGFAYSGSTPMCKMRLTNNALAQMDSFIVQFNTNYFGVAPVGVVSVPSNLQPKQSHVIEIPLMFGGNKSETGQIDSVQVAIKNNVDVFYFYVQFPLHLYFADIITSRTSEQNFINEWNIFTAIPQIERDLSGSLSEANLKNKLTVLRMFTLSVHTPPILSSRSVLMNGSTVLCQFLRDGQNGWKIVVRSNSRELMNSIVDHLASELALP